MLNLNDLALFVTAVEQGGFAAGGRHLGLPRSTLSKRVALLEDQLQVRLLQRSSRRFALTEIGQEFFERARAALSEVEAAETIVRGRQAEPSGTVRISASIPVVQGPLAACLPACAGTALSAPAHRSGGQRSLHRPGTGGHRHRRPQPLRSAA
ncbi:LysR family transcriptional regulator [Stenotrophomonas maltophilia]|uniref:LysR family transcriptional regulator n=1 Tax=Stenotrophomonas maltophilia TaxID=40324 RepID=UPI00215F0EFE|nr:LysR family transcriptional regulator [Stenotrophomonas maltophilia]